jgi:predicted PurR-regulated permease PerM
MINKDKIAYKAAIATFVALLLIALFLLIYHLPIFFLLIFGGILFGVLLSSLAHLVSRKTKIGYGISLLLVVLVLIGIIGGTAWFLAPTINQQVDVLAKSLPEALERLKAGLAKSSLGQKILEGIPDKPGKLLTAQKDVWSQVTGIFSSTLAILTNVIIIIITGIYLAISPGSYRKGFVSLITPGYRQRITEVLDKCYDTLSNWLISRSITMVVVGIATGIGLSVLGIPLPVVLAIIAGLLNFIPNIGPYIALAPALLLAYLQGPDKALYVAILYVSIQSLEGYVLTPLLDKKFVSTLPALLLFAQVLLGLLVGIGGVLVASPMVAVLIVIVNELYVKDYLEKNAKNQNNPENQTQHPVKTD